MKFDKENIFITMLRNTNNENTLREHLSRKPVKTIGFGETQM